MPHFYYSLGVFGVLAFLGDIWPGLILNVHCFALIGCNTGWLGYDGLMHFVSGVCVGLGLLWLKRHDVVQFAIWGFGIALVWELMESAYDTFRANVLSMNLLTPHNITTQPTGIDTISDIILGCLGTALVYLAYRRRYIHA